MKELEIFYPIFPSPHIEKANKQYAQKLKALFKSAEFKRRVDEVRDKFNIKLYGFKDYKGVDEKNIDAIKWNKKKALNDLSLLHTPNTLKELNFKIKSKKVKFQKAITQLRHYAELPIRFQDMLISFVMYNNWHIIGGYAAKCRVVVCKDGAENRLFIEIFGDTKKKDIIDALKARINLEKLKQKYKLKGNHLFRYQHYYEDKEITISTKNSEHKQDELSYYEKNIRKYRYRQFNEKHNNSK